MNRTSIFSITVAILILGSPVSRAADLFTGPIDNVSFQALVDSAKPGDTIRLSGGVYRFTGPVRITKSINIVALDLLDPPILEGTDDLRGDLVTGNRAFVVYKQKKDINGLEFIGLHFRDFRRVFQFVPQLDPFNAQASFGTFEGKSGVISGLVIDGDTATNVRRFFTSITGNLRDFRITNNHITTLLDPTTGGGGGAGEVGIFMDSTCNEFDDADGKPDGNRGFEFEDPDGSLFDIESLHGSKDGVIAGNHITSGRIGIFMSGVENVQVDSNTVATLLRPGGGQAPGIEVGYFSSFLCDGVPEDDPLDLGMVLGNDASNSEGIVGAAAALDLANADVSGMAVPVEGFIDQNSANLEFTFFANGYVAVIEPSFSAFLDETTFDNTVVVPPGQVEDNGTNNTIINPGGN